MKKKILKKNFEKKKLAKKIYNPRCFWIWKNSDFPTPFSYIYIYIYIIRIKP